ncbi:type II toxin-antitoxin system HicA family toxin [Xanthomonas sp. A1809]|uniref:type II toxin-antitoxin system HicA family toxin n=1 Tax=Xanthomonas sp. A1809 TaxID=2821275 RepID=UPI001ADC7DCF|nr:type II toxin-antitoxin system HicA family toxin [Xanthomonas sp. A1809]MBO9859280.1 type II toxin-antitoxin system HicA family toxin [Xanthomonas sp. A1809]
MGKHDKTLAKMCRKPTPSDVKWDDLQAALLHLGYELIKGNGSRRKFFHREKNRLINCHEPHPQPEVDKGCINDIVEHLRMNGFLEAEAK